MNLSDEHLVYLSIALAVPIALLAFLNWALRKRGGFAKGWAGAVFIGLCWVGAVVIIVSKVS